ncbi:malonic semialdehyde reductase [Roseospira marina]|uniref:Putative NADH dehydrogenase/NAD(P)H nitroreductase F1188_18745 n=1 Tax=Roseospira marina TaxID=140057 RepID=A0A5M6I6Y7_9PROT|nr:malonic semialdehyde reductase [Roseospira marina]KAA5603883.1 malonic semialdehyde reductase [Roseospira marina]MBB4313747.1 3-hydroxypropanoate dehydrogenase [Roseospira marina]MBB5086909.1 3-hydroxypropanoate dehydrogenase [Roseospira marina]
MSALDATALDALFLEARTHWQWQDRAVDDSTLERLHTLVKMAPTSANCQPARFVFIKSPEAKAKLEPCLTEGNRPKTMTAPVTVIVCEDLAFPETLPTLFPHADAKAWFDGKPAFTEETAFRNATLQGGYLILAARALGLDCGPMSGFDQAKVDATFLEGTTWRSNFLLNLGYGDPTPLFPRSPRPAFADVCRIV